jgi:hypothetical protein
MAKAAKPGSDDGLVVPGQASELPIEKRADEKVGRTLARLTLDPQTRNASVAMTFGGAMFGDKHRPDIVQSSAALAEAIEAAGKGDLGLASRVFASQAITLDTIFTELARRAAMNLGEYPQAVERYARLALKAQSNCRATLEALAKLHQPREQTVRHVHVNEGGQAVIADQFHNHAGDRENGRPVKQSDATRPAGASSALPSPDPFRSGVPVPGGEGETPLPDARRHESRRT